MRQHGAQLRGLDWLAHQFAAGGAGQLDGFHALIGGYDHTRNLPLRDPPHERDGLQTAFAPVEMIIGDDGVRNVAIGKQLVDSRQVGRREDGRAPLARAQFSTRMKSADCGASGSARAATTVNRDPRAGLERTSTR